MEEAGILSCFDRLVQPGVVLYDEEQEIIEKVDQELKPSYFYTPSKRGPALQEQTRDGSDISTGGYELGDISSNHFSAANKFCFTRPHLMLLTSNGHHRQYESLDGEEFAAALTALNTMGQDKDYAVFYNCGQDRLCSHLHKHMQLIPMPRDSFAAFFNSEDVKEPNIMFQWFHHHFQNQQVMPKDVTMIYTEPLKHTDQVGHSHSQHTDHLPPGSVCPHNMILMKHWIIVLPRQWAGINKEAGANAIAMLGYIAVAIQNEIENWIRLGPVEILPQLGVPKDL